MSAIDVGLQLKFILTVINLLNLISAIDAGLQLNLLNLIQQLMLDYSLNLP